MKKSIRIVLLIVAGVVSVAAAVPLVYVVSFGMEDSQIELQREADYQAGLRKMGKTEAELKAQRAKDREAIAEYMKERHGGR